MLPWTHVAATFDATLVAIYVNGAMVASLPGNGLPLLDAAGDLRVGKGDQKLNGVPGLVATWNFDNHFVDTSSGLVLTPVGAVAFNSNPLALTAPTMGVAHGASTPD